MNKAGQMTINRLETVLDAYGADPARWPDAVRAKLLKLAASEPRAARLLAEACALDRVLDAAPATDVSAALVSRIVAAAVADGSREARVVPLGAAREAQRAGFARRGRLMIGPAAALLAASFALGLYLGVGVVGQTTFGAAFEIASSDRVGEDLETLFANPDDLVPDQEGLL